MRSFLCEIVFSCLLAAPGARSVDELTYGTALYAYYQRDYDQALLQVMVAESQNRRGDDPIRFELAEGSFAFQQGLYRFAAETFDGVADAELTDLDRMRLAFHLARERYRRGDWAGLEAELAQIDLGANWLGRERRHPEVSFMRAEAALARSDFPAAEAALAELSGRDGFLAYGLFNLGVAYRAAGSADRARDAFRRLADLHPTRDEAWDLVQRGRLALAVMARQSGDSVDARTLLGTLPGSGRYRDRALASYANLAMTADDHELAARIWLTLLEQEGWSAGRAAAHLGLPMSLEKLASPAHALARYRAAEQAFEARLAALEGTAGRTGDRAWIDRLLDAFADPDELARTRALGELDAGLGAASWLEWLSGEEVHQVLVEWRELTGMAAWLAALPERIDAFDEITVERRRRTMEAGLLLDDENLASRRAVLAERVAGLERNLTELAQSAPRPDRAWMGKLATGEERALIDELAAMSALVGAQMPPPDRARCEARIRRLMGVLFWQIADERAARVRVLAKRLNENRALLADVDARMARLAGAEARFAAGVETDFLALRARTREVRERVVAALDQRRHTIARALQRGLEQEMARTRQYLLTARVAIARATDQLATTEPDAGDGES